MEKNTKKFKRKNYYCGTKNLKGGRGITLIALVITIVLNCSYLAMERMLKKVKILKKEKTSCII